MYGCCAERRSWGRCRSRRIRCGKTDEALAEALYSHVLIASERQLIELHLTLWQLKLEVGADR